MKVAIVGTGYVGLTTGTCLAEIGNSITCVDIDKSKIDLLMKGVSPIHEKGLTELIQKNYREERLFFTTNFADALNNNDLVMIAVGTPPREDGSADLNYVLAVAKQIGEAMTTYKLVVTKSTVPVGTGDKIRGVVQSELDRRKLNIEFSVASNPEFLKEGAAVADFMKPDRIVVGATDKRGEDMLRELYRPFVEDGHRFIAMSMRSSELCKYASNAMLATKISFMNELSQISEALEADIIQVREGMGADRRIGYEFTNAGIGYGGSCFPKDVKALVNTTQTSGLNPSLLVAVEAVNKHQRERFITKVLEGISDIKGKKVAVWGLSFKPETDDVREAPALDVIEALLNAGALVVGHDPVAMQNASDMLKEVQSLPGQLTFSDGMYEALEGADALVLCTEWNSFKSPDFDRMKSAMKVPMIFDGRNQYDPKSLRTLGFNYLSIGR